MILRQFSPLIVGSLLSMTTAVAGRLCTQTETTLAGGGVYTGTTMSPSIRGMMQRLMARNVPCSLQAALRTARQPMVLWPMKRNHRTRDQWQ